MGKLKAARETAEVVRSSKYQGMLTTYAVAVWKTMTPAMTVTLSLSIQAVRVTSGAATSCVAIPHLPGRVTIPRSSREGCPGRGESPHLTGAAVHPIASAVTRPLHSPYRRHPRASAARSDRDGGVSNPIPCPTRATPVLPVWTVQIMTPPI
jgi:hypothetical protein